MIDYREEVKAQFDKATTEHVLTVELDSGLFRSIVFKRPTSVIYSYRVTTWPGYLAITGDVGHYVFQRTQDMFEFFRDDGGRINPSYWAGKCQAGETQRFDSDAWEALINRIIEELSEAQDDIPEEIEDLKDSSPSSSHEAIHLLYEAGVLDAFEYSGSLESYTHQFLWCLFGIVKVIALYDAHHAEKAAE